MKAICLFDSFCLPFLYFLSTGVICSFFVFFFYFLNEKYDLNSIVFGWYKSFFLNKSTYLVLIAIKSVFCLGHTCKLNDSKFQASCYYLLNIRSTSQYDQNRKNHHLYAILFCLLLHNFAEHNSMRKCIAHDETIDIQFQSSKSLPFFNANRNKSIKWFFFIWISIIACVTHTSDLVRINFLIVILNNGIVRSVQA